MAGSQPSGSSTESAASEAPGVEASAAEAAVAVLFCLHPSMLDTPAAQRKSTPMGESRRSTATSL